MVFIDWPVPQSGFQREHGLQFALNSSHRKFAELPMANSHGVAFGLDRALRKHTLANIFRNFSVRLSSFWCLICNFTCTLVYTHTPIFH